MAARPEHDRLTAYDLNVFICPEGQPKISGQQRKIGQRKICIEVRLGRDETECGKEEERASVRDGKRKGEGTGWEEEEEEDGNDNLT